MPDQFLVDDSQVSIQEENPGDDKDNSGDKPPPGGKYLFTTIINSPIITLPLKKRMSHSG
jgi:hypothetical protein